VFTFAADMGCTMVPDDSRDSRDLQTRWSFQISWTVHVMTTNTMTATTQSMKTCADRKVDPEQEQRINGCSVLFDTAIVSKALKVALLGAVFLNCC
jgi:hypothetical protein